MPVVIAANGLGIPVTDVASGAPLAIISANGYGVPIVLVASGGIPMIVTPSGGGGTPFVPPVVMGLTNPGAEAGDASGWTVVGSNSLFSSITSTGGFYPGPKTGSRYFAGAITPAARMYQDVDVSAYASAIDSGQVVADLLVWIAGFEPTTDHGSIFLKALDVSNTVLSTVALEELYLSNPTWITQNLAMLLPADTRKVRIELLATRITGGDNDTNFDDIALTLRANSHAIPGRYDTTISRGNRTGIITVSATNIATGGGSLSGLVDGSQSNDYYFTTATGNGTGWLKFDFGAGSAWMVDEFILRQHNNTSHGTWRMEGSNDDSSWTQIGSDFTLVPGVNQPGNPSQAFYRYIRLRHMSGSRSTSPYLREIEFRAK